VVREEIVGVYRDALKVVWIVGAVITGLGFLLVFVEREIKLRTELESEYGMKEKKKGGKAVAVAEIAV
jgi:beta-lactamase regulating signal transducer with metallopeptidase domain